MPGLPSGLPRALRDGSASFAVARVYRGAVPSHWEREISADELVDALARTGYARRAGSGRFECIVRGLTVHGQWHTPALGPGGTVTLSLTVRSGGWTIDHLRAAAKVLGDFEDTLKLMDGDKVFAGAPRRPFAPDMGAGVLEWLVGAYEDDLTELAAAALPDRLLGDLAGAGDAELQVLRAADAVSPMRAAGVKVKVDSVTLERGRLAVVSPGRGHAIVALAAYLEDADATLWSPGRWPPRDNREVPAPNRTLWRVSAALAALMLASWLVPVGWWPAAAALALLVVGVPAWELHRRRVRRRQGGLAVAVLLWVIGFGCLYAICGRDGVELAGGGHPDRLGELMLVSLGVATTAGPLTTQLASSLARFFAHLELLFSIASVGFGIRLAARSAAAALARYAPELERWIAFRENGHE